MALAIIHLPESPIYHLAEWEPSYYRSLCGSMSTLGDIKACTTSIIRAPVFKNICPECERRANENSNDDFMLV
jgi:hypothetical protein